MPDHPVKRTLERDVLPYIVSARQLRKQWFYRMHTVFGYTTDIVVALATIGIAPPLLRLIGATGSAADVADKPLTLTSALASLPPALVYPAAVLIVVWIIIRVAFSREEGQKRECWLVAVPRSFNRLRLVCHRRLVQRIQCRL